MIRELLNRYSHINWALADQALVSGVNFLTGLLLARVLGLESFGVYTLLWMVVQFVNSIQMALISAPMMSIGPKQADDLKLNYYQAVLGHQLIFSVTSVLISILVLLSVSHYFPEWQITKILLPLVLVIFFNQNQDFLRRLFFSTNKPKKAFLSDIVSYGGQISLVISLYVLGSIDLIFVLWVVALSSAVAVVIGIFDVGAPNINGEDLNKVWIRHWGYSKWSVLTALLQWGSGNLVFVFCGALLGASAVGALKAAQNIMAALHIIFQGMENFVPAKASEILHYMGVNPMRGYIYKVLAVGCLGLCVFSLAIFGMAEELMALLYGRDYSKYGYILQWFSVVYVCMYIAMPLRFGLRALESTKSIFKAQLISVLFVCAGGWYLVLIFEIEGALFALLLSYLITCLMTFIGFTRSMKNNLNTPSNSRLIGANCGH